MAKSIGFYQNFNLTFDRLSTALRCIQTNPRVSHSELAECMSVNRPIGEGYSAWLTHTGLAIAKQESSRGSLTYHLTPFGQLAFQFDPLLRDLGTQWVIHYYLATEHLERSEAWVVFANQFFTVGQRFTSDQFRRFFADVAGTKIHNRSALDGDPPAVLYSYTNPKSMARLGMLRKEKQIYVCARPVQPHILVIGYVLLDWWARHYGQVDTLRFSQLCREEGSLGRVFQADVSQVKNYVSELTNQGYLNFSETQHEPVNRLYTQPAYTLLERYYVHR